MINKVTENAGFHSISFPSEWGVLLSPEASCLLLQVSIQLASPASGEGIKKPHLENCLALVSIQLASPASGELIFLMSRFTWRNSVSIQLASPASGELPFIKLVTGTLKSFHSISFPSEWGVKPLHTYKKWRELMFPFN